MMLQTCKDYETTEKLFANYAYLSQGNSPFLSAEMDLPLLDEHPGWQVLGFVDYLTVLMTQLFEFLQA